MSVELRCPDCNKDLMEHLSSFCLEEWVNLAVFGDKNRAVNGYSYDIRSAWLLMEKVWEMDEEARIERDAIVVRDSGWFDWRRIEGETFPLRVCRAAIWLANEREGQEK